VNQALNQAMTSIGKLPSAFAVVAIVLSLGGAVWMGCKPSQSSDSASARQRGARTFNRDVAPILFQHCAPCHRPGQSAPFSLLSYADALKHASEISEVTQKRYMPPWLPEPGYGEFRHERRLTAGQIGTIQKWFADGAPEGDPADRPGLPKFPEGWQLGEPDLVVQMPQPYTLSAEGRDIYRNFVIPAPVSETRFVRAFEFHPNNKSVHHVRILLDATRQSRRLDEQDPEPGFAGMRPPAQFPPGHMLTWVLGKVPGSEPEGLPWLLEGDTDLVLQIHMQRTGKPELIQPAIGLYFTNKPPARAALVVGLLSELIDIAPGENNYVVERTFKLPVDVQVLGVLPHLHYLGKEAQGFARLPDGTQKWLISIRHWDFNWQGEYRYTQPVFLPKGSLLTMRYTYDNSDANVRNPNHPPRRVVFGPQSTDEMGELWLQVLPNTTNDLAILQHEKRLMDARETVAFYENFLRTHPDDAPSHVGLGKVLGPLGQTAAAASHFRTALKLNPSQSEAHYYLGLILFDERQFQEARAEFESELRIDPNYYKAHVGLGLICIEEQNLDQAETQLKAAMQINPKDRGVQQMLVRIAKAKVESKP